MSPFGGVTHGWAHRFWWQPIGRIHWTLHCCVQDVWTGKLNLVCQTWKQGRIFSRFTHGSYSPHYFVWQFPTIFVLVDDPWLMLLMLLDSLCWLYLCAGQWMWSEEFVMNCWPDFAPTLQELSFEVYVQRLACILFVLAARWSPKRISSSQLTRLRPPKCCWLLWWTILCCKLLSCDHPEITLQSQPVFSCWL